MDVKKLYMYIVGIYLTLWIVVLVGLLFVLWPRSVNSSQQVTDANTPSVQLTVSNQIVEESNQPGQTVSSDSGHQETDSTTSTVEQCPITGLRFLVLALIMGALGACLHGISSIAYHRGRKKFSESWTLWYLYRPFVGAILALIFYLIIKGGLMPQFDSNSKEFFLILGLSGLIGLFSKQALNKLSLIFDAIFASDKDNNK